MIVKDSLNILIIHHLLYILKYLSYSVTFLLNSLCYFSWKAHLRNISQSNMSTFLHSMKYLKVSTDQLSQAVTKTTSKYLLYYFPKFTFKAYHLYIWVLFLCVLWCEGGRFPILLQLSWVIFLKKSHYSFFYWFKVKLLSQVPKYQEFDSVLLMQLVSH